MVAADLAPPYAAALTIPVSVKEILLQRRILLGR